MQIGDARSASALVDALRRELKARGVTYRMLAREVGMSESSIKRMLSRKDLTLRRLDSLCRAAQVGFDELARAVADAAPMTGELTLQQEKEVVADPKLLLVAVCCLNNWAPGQIVQTYRISEAECVRLLVRLDRLGIIELKPLNRYRLTVSKAFRWRPDGPVQAYFRRYVVGDYFAGRFDRPGETLLLVHGSISRAMAQVFADQIQRLASEFAAQHQADQKVPAEHRDGYTVMLAMRNWQFSVLDKLRR
jgi:transcriptional regulator with XRE-family HTH domain